MLITAGMAFWPAGGAECVLLAPRRQGAQATVRAEADGDGSVSGASGGLQR